MEWVSAPLQNLTRAKQHHFQCPVKILGTNFLVLYVRSERQLTNLKCASLRSNNRYFNVSSFHYLAYHQEDDDTLD